MTDNELALLALVKEYQALTASLIDAIERAGGAPQVNQDDDAPPRQGSAKASKPTTPPGLPAAPDPNTAPQSNVFNDDDDEDDDSDDDDSDDEDDDSDDDDSDDEDDDEDDDGDDN